MRVLKKLNQENLLFYDIETATVVKELELDTPLFDSWKWKCDKTGEMNNDEIIASFKDKAGLYPEFSKIVSLVVGKIIDNKILLMTFDDPDEAKLLTGFNDAIERNIKCDIVGFFSSGFDTPFTYKRMLINGIIPHDKIDNSGLKPWEISGYDLATEWKGSSFERASLLSIATAFGLPSPKDGDVAGKEVGEVYWRDGKDGLARISKYCRRDVVTTINVFKKMRLEEPLERSTEEVIPIEELPFMVKLLNGGAYNKIQKDDLMSIFKGMDQEEREMGYVILNSIVSGAKGKKTKLTKAHVKELKSTMND